MKQHFNLAKQQQGSALIISLIILVLMLIIGTTGMQSTILEEKMAGNSRDLNNAFQAAESGLLDAEQHIEDFVEGRNFRDTAGALLPFSADCGASTTGISADDGLCAIAGAGTPQWLQAAAWKSYGSQTGMSNLPPAGRQQPNFIIESLSAGGPPPPGESLATGKSPQPKLEYYRATTQGFGIAEDDANQPLARVMLQSIYAK